MPCIRKLPLLKVGWNGEMINRQEACLNGANGMKGGEWLENDGFSRHSRGKSNSRKKWRCLDSDPYTIYTFSQLFRVSSPMVRVLSPFCLFLSSFWCF